MNIKYKFNLFIIFLILILGFNIVDAKRNERLNLFGKVITVDAGHPSNIRPKKI